MVVVYDVEQARVNKICQYLRRFLHWVQNSAFEGELTEAQLARLKVGLKKIIVPESDSVYIYRLPSKKYVRKEIVGRERALTEQILE